MTQASQNPIIELEGEVRTLKQSTSLWNYQAVISCRQLAVL